MSKGSVFAEIVNERARQDSKWGEQNHPDGTGGELAIALAGMLRSLCGAQAAHGQTNWTNIAAEEIGEAFAEIEPGPLRAELVQCAAVFVAWIEAMDRRLDAVSLRGGSIRCHPGVWDSIRQVHPAGTPRRAADSWQPSTGALIAWLIGLPVVRDEAMAPGTWRLYDRDGVELRRGFYPEPKPILLKGDTLARHE